MPSTNHILCFLLAVLIHVLGLLMLGCEQTRRETEETVQPELDVSSLELTLTEMDNDGGSGSAAPQAAAQQTTPPAEPQPTLDVPQPPDPVPPPTLPDKPTFDDALVPPPEPVPPPTPKPTPPPPVTKPQPAPKPTPAPAQTTSSQPTTAAAGDTSQGPTLSPAGGGSYGRIDTHPSLRRAIKPNYPIGARRRGEEGTVILDVVVSADGHASSVSLVSSCGFSELDAAAVRAAGQARFKPGTRNGEPAESAARLTIIFRLRDQ